MALSINILLYFCQLVNMIFYLRWFNLQEEYLLEIANIGGVRWILPLKNFSQDNFWFQIGNPAASFYWL